MARKTLARLQGSREIKKLLKAADKASVSAAMSEMKKAAEDAERIAKMNAPESDWNAWAFNKAVEAGSIAPCSYRNSIEAFSFKGREAYGIKGHYYGWFLEFGTPKIRAKPHIRPAIAKVRKTMCKKMLEALTSVTAGK